MSEEARKERFYDAIYLMLEDIRIWLEEEAQERETCLILSPTPETV